MSVEHWTNRLAFIVATSSFAIGLGNIWRFPYLVGENGGGAFLLVYLLLVFLFGIPILLTEVSLGRMAQTTALQGYGRLSGNKNWNLLGWLEVIAGLLVMTYYVMIIAWVGIYFVESVRGNLLTVPRADFVGHFSEVTGDFWTVCGGSALFTVLAGLVVRLGLKNGIEKVSRWLMPLLLILILILGVWAVTLDGAGAGIRWYLSFDFSKITVATVLAALGQLFFSIGVGFSTAFVFGSYSEPKEDIVASTGTVVLMDTLVAFLAGFMIFPALFAFRIAPDAGPSLVFITMAQLFAALPFGQLFGSLFFLLLILAGFTSLTAAVEGITASVSDRFGIARLPALALVVAIILLFAIPNILSYSAGTFSAIAGRSFFEWMDFLTNVVLLPVAGLLIMLFSVYVVGFRSFQRATNEGAGYFRITRSWEVLAKVIIPLGILTILLNSFW